MGRFINKIKRLISQYDSDHRRYSSSSRRAKNYKRSSSDGRYSGSQNNHKYYKRRSHSS